MLSTETIVKAWESEEFMGSLTEEQRQQLPENPAGKPKFKTAQASDDPQGLFSFTIYCTWQGGCFPLD